jgi:tetratricopeptide (TPR) repeat protein
MGQERQANTKLAALVAESGWSYARLAAALVQVAWENGAPELAATGRSHIARWLTGTVPSGRAPQLLCETLARRLGRPVSLFDAGFGALPPEPDPGQGWDVDTLAALADLGRIDIATRREVLAAATYQTAALTVPGLSWWHAQQAQPTVSRAAGHVVNRAELEAVRETTAYFTRVDQRRGGGHARTAVTAYLFHDVANYLAGPFIDEATRRAMFSAAGELAYLGGWARFDNGEHGPASRLLQVAAKLAGEAGDEPLVGHILRAIAHQAIDLGHVRQGLNVAEASIAGQRYAAASPREKALLGIVHAKALGAAGQRSQAAAALLRAEADLATAAPGDDEPDRVFFFGEASLAMESGCTLRDLGDLTGAEIAFRRSVALRRAATFTRTHAVTLGYLGEVQLRRGHLEEACATWRGALDAADGIASGRTRAVARDIRRGLTPFRARGSRMAADLDARARDFLQAAA